QKLRVATSSQSPSSRGYSVRASDCSPLPLLVTGPITAATSACEAHSLIVTTRAFGNPAPLSASPPVPAYPNSAAFSLASGTSHPNPSMVISRHGPRNAPSVPASAADTATCANSSRSGSCPSRCRAWVIPPRVGTSHASPQDPPPPQRPGQPDDDLLRVILAEQRHRHREVHHDVRRELPARPLRAPARGLHRVIDRIPGAPRTPARPARSSRSEP